MLFNSNPGIREYKFDGFKFDVAWSSKVNMTTFHYHDEYELYYLLDGDCKYFIDNSLYSITKNELILIAPEVLHKTLYDTSTTKRISMNFSPEFVPSEMKDAVAELFEHNVYIPQNHDEILDILKKINYELTTADTYAQTMIKCHTVELLSILIRNKSKPVTDKNTYINEAIDGLIKYIYENLSQDITLSTAAKYTNFSVSYLSKLFLKTTGLGFKDYVQTLRIKESRTLLETTNMPINKVASQCGFNDSNYFSKVFKDSVGISPLKYRKMTNKD